MLPNLSGEHSSQEARLRSQFIWYRAIALLILISAIAGWWMLYSANQTSWLALTRPLIAAAFLGYAVVENVGFQLAAGTVPPAEQAIVTEEKKKRRWHFTLPPRVKGWCHHIYQHLVTAACAALALILIDQNFSASGALTPIAQGQVPAASLLLAVCFALLVCERMLSFRRIRAWVSQTACVGLLRALLSICLLTTVALAVINTTLWVSQWILYAVCALLWVIAVEFLLRALATIWIAPRPKGPARFLTQSLIAEQFRWPLHPLLSLRKKIADHFGVDIGQIQAFRLMGKIIVPVACGLAFIGWLMSGLNQVSVNQRGVYERFGNPTDVLLPGVHIGLPWPFGRVLPVDYGTVHELALSDEQPTQPVSAAVAKANIEGPAPMDSWRLWDSSHSTDQAQVIASAVGDKQSFQIVNMDIRLIWRVGMHDRDAMNSLYQTDDLPTTIQRVARQVMTQYFSHQQLDELLNEQRATMSMQLNQQIQQRLDRMNTGVELLYTRIESIHPPAGAANAYHGVQAAQIAANAQIAREKGYAASRANDALRKATTATDNAQAMAGELQDKATASLTLYSADYEAWKLNPEAYLNERRYQSYSKALSKAPLLILDSQVAGHNPSMLDLRQYSQPTR
ncbi:protease modulator HflK [Enterobacteriaceae bacterium RIT691]|nr:protease modulator HflK [Enterobacteriaceae bacterium RIT691]